MEYHSVHNEVIEKTAEQVFSPVMYAYVSWVLEKAEQKKYKKALFSGQRRIPDVSDGQNFV